MKLHGRVKVLIGTLVIVCSLAGVAAAHHPAAGQPVGVQTICGEQVHYNAHDIIMDGQFRGLYAVQARAKEAAGQCRPVAASQADRSVAFALAQRGDAYRYGATGPDAWDCSGLVQAALRAGGVNAPRTSSEIKAAGTRVPLSQIRAGDVVAYSGHVALAIGNGQQVAATKPSTGVRQQAIYSGALYGVRF